MIVDEIFVANLKCTGCATTIKNKLHSLKGVSSIVVDTDQSKVVIETQKPMRVEIIDALNTLGYPEATAQNGLLLQLKSYASCMVGRLNN